MIFILGRIHTLVILTKNGREIREIKRALTISRTEKHYVTFICKNRGIFASDCDNGRFEWHFVKCACPAGSTAKDNGKCVKNNFVTAKDVQCSTPTTPPSPSPSKPYIFKYEVKDFEFEPPLNNIDTKKVSSTSNGIISNCADPLTASLQTTK